MKIKNMSAYTIPGIRKKDLVNTIEQTTMEYFDIAKTDLYSRWRRRHVATARFVIFHLLRKHTDLSLLSIGERFNRDHTAVIYGIKALNNWMQYDEALCQAVAEIEHKSIHKCEYLSVGI